MRNAISIFVIIALAVIGIAASQNYQGNAKGPDDPRADVVGENQSLPVLALSRTEEHGSWEPGPR